MHCLSVAMRYMPVGIAYASFAGLCIVFTALVGFFKFGQVPNLYSLVGLGLIIAGVVITNLLSEY
jgi:small multidrug resistance pump